MRENERELQETVYWTVKGTSGSHFTSMDQNIGSAVSSNQFGLCEKKQSRTFHLNITQAV